MNENAPEATPPTSPAGWYQQPDGTQRFWSGAAWVDEGAPPFPAPQPAVTHGPRFVEDRANEGAVTAIAWVIAILTVGYMLPWAIAASRGRPNAGAIGLVNFLAGWTGIGWIIALVMACQANQRYLVS